MDQSPAAQLKQHFGDLVTLAEQPAVPETVAVSATGIANVCRFCRDTPELDFQALSCLSGVDHPDRIELVYHLLSYRRKHELMLKVSLNREKPEIDSVESVWRTADWHERECYDLLGVVFRGHPDLRRLLLPDDWVGYPLRKDYVPPTEYHGMSHSRVNPLALPDPAAAQPATSAPARCVQELTDLSQLREAVRPLSDSMLVNMGPQHPSTHGVLNFLLVTDGEVMHKAVPHVGYLHRGMEKLAEGLSYHGYMPFTDRLDYLASMFANHGYALAVEKLLGCVVPPRAESLRVIACELNRIASHLVATGAMTMDIGAFTPFVHWLRERECLNDILEALCGSRLTYNYMRIGGVGYDLPEGWTDRVLRWLDHFDPALDEFERLISGNAIFVERLADVACISPEDAIGYGLTGPNLRASGVDWDLRRDLPYSGYAQLRFDVPLGRGFCGTVGDCYDRFVVRLLEMRQSCQMLRQAIEALPAGDVLAKVPRKLKLPAGETYARVEAPRGEMGFYLISDGGETPYRLKVRTGSFTAMSITEQLSRGVMIADLVAIIGSLDVIAPEIDR
ncbi:MAG: NADH-quinone oxidoreductase subunit D [bacterium]